MWIGGKHGRSRYGILAEVFAVLAPEPARFPATTATTTACVSRVLMVHKSCGAQSPPPRRGQYKNAPLEAHAERLFFLGKRVSR